MKITKYRNHLPLSNKIYRMVWLIGYYCFFRIFPGRLFSRWRIFVLRCFGAEIGRGCQVYASAEIWSPKNLQLGEYVAVAPHARLYNPTLISIGAHCTVSQYSHLCTASHDITDGGMALITSPIRILPQAWVAADAFVGMGVTIGEGAVIGARACVFKDVEPWTVVGGNPAHFIKKRKLSE